MAFYRALCLKGTFRFQKITSTSKLFHNSCAQTSFKQSKMLNKLLTRGNRKKFNVAPMDYNQSVIKTESKGKINPSKMRRAEQVSKILFSYICDLIQYGDEDFPQIEETIEISKVKISPDFSALVVHWVATGTEKDDIIQQMLIKNSSKIRQHLINLRLVGTLPPITFTPDLSEVKYQTVVNLLKSADMGFEGEQLSTEDLLKQQPKLLSKHISGSLEKEINENLNKMVENSLSTKGNKDLALTSEKALQNLPEADSDLKVADQFENDIYHLDHSHLMRIVKEKQSSERKPSLELEEESRNALSLSNQKFIHQYSKMVEKRKKPPKLKEYTYYQYLKEEEEKKKIDD